MNEVEGMRSTRESRTAGSEWNSTRGDFKRKRQSNAKNEATIEERLTSRIELKMKLILKFI